ncbi:MAG: SipW-dependent-type signal peptide-containing protein [Acidimicrobiales bacterium]|jgi:predicted ribosomally synthesized peptide with SipW-like signal peptide
MKLKTVAMTGVLSLAGLGLIGAGAHAQFTQTTQSTQQIDAGTMNVQLSTLVPGASLSNSNQTLTFALSTVGSTFTTGDQLVTITNYSNIPVLEIESTPSDTYNGASTAATAFAGEVYMCEVSSGTVIYNGALSAAPAQAITGSLTAYPGPGNTDSYSVNFYAGTVTTGCGSATSGAAVSGTSTAPELLPAAEGGVINPTLTVSYSG